MLASLERHLRDDTLHVVAAPGAGKTVVGLEVARRLGRPALVFAPTRTVRDQWRARLLEDFQGAAALPDGSLSDALERPGLITFATYQALFAARRRGGGEQLVARLAEAGVGTLVLDEAHHLRRAWWRALEWLCRRLGEHQRVSLTATPPTDVPQQEWNRYIALCGAIDDEVTVPELVEAGTLCPHQDLAWLCRPEVGEQAALARHEEGVRGLFLDLRIDQDLAARVAEQPLVADPDRVDTLELEPRLALAQWLGEVHGRIPAALLEPLGLMDVPRPPLTREGAEGLLQALLFDHREALTGDPVLVERLDHWQERLGALGATSRRRVVLRNPVPLVNALRRSRSKLAAAVEVVELEHAERGASLRAAVLADHVRAEALGGAHDALGAAPLFDRLRRRRLPGLELALLTGRLVLVPETVAAALARAGVELVPEPRTPGFSRAAEGASGAVVRLVTGALGRGELNVIVGSTALLGEGWDAPALDTLVLATSVSTAMTSNQLRGRAIRQGGDDGKVANLWHLACVGEGEAGGEEVARLARRLDSAIVLRRDTTPPLLESGGAGLGLASVRERGAVAGHNAWMAGWASDRSGVALAWSRALDRSTRTDRAASEIRLSPQRMATPAALRLRVLSPLRRFWLRRTLRRLGAAVIAAFQEAGLLDEPASVAAELRDDGLAIAVLAESHHARRLVADALGDLLDPLRDPRWAVVRRRELYGVPAKLAGRRQHAEQFSRAFRRHVGRHRLHYTRRGEGALLLRAARARAWWERERFRLETRTRWGAGGQVGEGALRG